jgi:hypothetical protein
MLMVLLQKPFWIFFKKNLSITLEKILSLPHHSFCEQGRIIDVLTNAHEFFRHNSTKCRNIPVLATGCRWV